MTARLPPGGDPPHPDAVSERMRSDVDSISRWMESERGRRVAGMTDHVHAHARREVIRRIAAITRRAPAHLRPRLSTLAAAARRAAVVQVGAGAERVLSELAAAPLADEPWLRAVSTFADLHARAAGTNEPEKAPRLIALLTLCRG